MASSTNHRHEAERLLEQALTYPPSSAARLAALVEAQVHAILVLSDPFVVLNSAVDYAPPVDAPTPDEAPTKTPRRPRKAASVKEPTE